MEPLGSVESVSVNMEIVKILQKVMVLVIVILFGKVSIVILIDVLLKLILVKKNVLLHKQIANVDGTVIPMLSMNIIVTTNTWYLLTI